MKTIRYHIAHPVVRNAQADPSTQLEGSLLSTILNYCLWEGLMLIAVYSLRGNDAYYLVTSPEDAIVMENFIFNPEITLCAIPYNPEIARSAHEF